ncbi:hypothetical protein AVEN_209930-1 [Araneus ventricosus]|uniref:Uncharacterized protein n=1 Tax=Araneus ventricosus TaxID=182803 RepID=A0A4Y2DB68_ARAVE|nr:hypothetical protein AVEN_209930-1 [Araneus ventricosus]
MSNMISNLQSSKHRLYRLATAAIYGFTIGGFQFRHPIPPEICHVCSLVLSFVMNNPAAENVLSASADVGGIVFKASPSFIIFDDRFSVESNSSVFTIFVQIKSLAS